MKNKNIFIGLLIYGVGIGTGYAVAVKRLKTKFREDVASVKDFYADKLEELGVMEKDFEPETMIVEEDDDSEDEEEYPEPPIQTGYRGRGTPIYNYNKPPLEVVARCRLKPEEPEEPEELDEDGEDPAYEAA